MEKSLFETILLHLPDNSGVKKLGGYTLKRQKHSMYNNGLVIVPVILERF